MYRRSRARRNGLRFLLAPAAGARGRPMRRRRLSRRVARARVACSLPMHLPRRRNVPSPRPPSATDTAFRAFATSVPTKTSPQWSMARPPTVRIDSATPSNPRGRSVGRATSAQRTHSLTFQRAPSQHSWSPRRCDSNAGFKEMGSAGTSRTYVYRNTTFGFGAEANLFSNACLPSTAWLTGATC
jgi:hypothetical protein